MSCAAMLIAISAGCLASDLNSDRGIDTVELFSGKTLRFQFFAHILCLSAASHHTDVRCAGAKRKRLGIRIATGGRVSQSRDNHFSGSKESRPVS